MTPEELEQKTIERSRYLAQSLKYVFNKEISLDIHLIECEFLLKEKRSSIEHIMTTFNNVSVNEKIQLAYYLFYPHVKKQLEVAHG